MWAKRSLPSASSCWFISTGRWSSRSTASPTGWICSANRISAEDFSSRLAPVRQAEADRIVDMFNRMMDQLKNERLRLREQNHFLDLLINVSPMGVVILDFDGKISMLNAAALRFLGYTMAGELIGKRFQDLDAPLAGEIARLPKDTVDTIRLSDAMTVARGSRSSTGDSPIRLS